MPVKAINNFTNQICSFCKIRLAQEDGIIVHIIDQLYFEFPELNCFSFWVYLNERVLRYKTRATSQLQNNITEEINFVTLKKLRLGYEEYSGNNN